MVNVWKYSKNFITNTVVCFHFIVLVVNVFILVIKIEVMNNLLSFTYGIILFASNTYFVLVTCIMF